MQRQNFGIKAREDMFHMLMLVLYHIRPKISDLMYGFYARQILDYYKGRLELRGGKSTYEFWCYIEAPKAFCAKIYMLHDPLYVVPIERGKNHQYYKPVIVCYKGKSCILENAEQKADVLDRLDYFLDFLSRNNIPGSDRNANKKFIQNQRCLSVFDVLGIYLKRKDDTVLNFNLWREK